MALVSTTRGYKGRGKFVIKPLSGGRPFELGNVTNFSEAIEFDRQGRQSYESAGGGEKDVTEDVTSFTFEATVNDITPQNIALGFLAGVEELGAQSITDEAHDAWAGTRVGTRYLPDPDEELTVATDEDTPVPLVEGTDYERTAHGIVIAENPSNISFSGDEPTGITISYERNPQYLIQALTESQKEFELRWEGLNSVDNGNPMGAVYFRVKFSATSGFARHGGDEFAEMTLSGTILEDESRVGSGLSKFMESTMI